MKNSIIISSVLLMLFYFGGCKEEGRVDIIDKNAPAPEAVSSVEVENIAGGAVIRYSVPQDPNLLYVKAVYENKPGNTRETKSSYYLDSLIVDGFGNTETSKVYLYSVGRNEKESQPVTVDITPLTPPVIETFNSLKMRATFGGVRVEFQNPHEANLSFVMLADTAIRGNMELLETYYYSAPVGNFALRGMEPEENAFGVYVRDRWGNSSDTLVMNLTPLYEEAIPKPYASHKLPSDNHEPNAGDEAGFGMGCLWDNSWDQMWINHFATTSTTPLPATITIDMKCTAVLSRIVVHHRSYDPYQASHPKRFQLWGTNDAVPQDDLFGGGWTLLGNFESAKPSGSGSTVTEEDAYYANVLGENFEVEATDEVTNPSLPVRYVRLRVLETWAGNTTMGQILIAELTLHGQIMY